MVTKNIGHRDRTWNGSWHPITSAQETIQKAPVAEAQTALGKRRYMSYYRNSVKNCFLTQNFTEIGQSAAALWPKTIFNMAALRHLEFKKKSYFVTWLSSRSNCVVDYQIPLKSDGFYRATCMHSAHYAVARCLSVCLSVCPSVRPSHAGIVCKRLHISSKFFSPSGSPTILVYHTKLGGNIPTETPLAGMPNARGYEKNHDFRPISRFISWTGARCGHSYYRKRIGNRTQAFEWYQFE